MYTFSVADAASAAACGLVHKRSLSADPAAPLFLLVHGRAGTCDVMSAFKSCLPSGCNVLLPQAPAAEAQGGFSWWTVPEDISYRERAAAAADVLRSFLDRALILYSLRPSRIIALGFSQGAAVLSVVIQRHAELLSGAALLAGFVVERSVVAGEATPMALPKVFMAHGTNDEVVAVARARKSAEFLRDRGFMVDYYEDPVGHKVGSQGMRELKAFAARLAQEGNASKS